MKAAQFLLMFGGDFFTDAMVIDGQSNALGVANGASFATNGMTPDVMGIDLLEPIPRVFIYFYDEDELQPLHIAVNNMSVNNANYVHLGTSPQNIIAFGPELGYAYAWIQDHPTGNLVIIKDSGDGQPISYFAPGLSRDDLRLSRHAAAFAACEAQGFKLNVRALAWVQGESGEANNYAAALTQRIASWRTDGTINPKTIIVLPQIPPGSGLYDSTVNSAKDVVAASDPMHIKTINYPNSFNADSVHLNAYGQMRMGANIYAVAYNRPPITLPGD